MEKQPFRAIIHAAATLAWTVENSFENGLGRSCHDIDTAEAEVGRLEMTGRACGESSTPGGFTP
jgi:hypothetical protein